jgi:ABC-type antimicrobial peptide transport system permease subunit
VGGVYGIVAFHVARRTHEIGVRVALGATVGDVTGRVLRRGALLAVGVLACVVPARSALSVDPVRALQAE